MKRTSFEFEIRRQTIHVLLGLALLATLYLAPLSRTDAVAYSTGLVLLGMLYLLIVIDRRSKEKPSPLADYLIDSLERKGAPPAHGALWYLIGLLITLTFISDFNGIAATVFLCLLYTSPSPRDLSTSRMPSSA